MARREEQDQQTQQGGNENRSAGGSSTATARGNSGGSQTSGATGGASTRGETRSDQERSREVAREQGSTGSAVRQGTGRQMGRDLGARRGGSAQPTILPAMMANPGLMTRALLANPFAFAQAMSEEMDRVFTMADRGDLWQGGQSGRGGRTSSGWSPALEVVQKENELVVCADLPGLKPDDVQIDIEDHVLTISGERLEKHEDRRDGAYRSERSYGSFTRSIALPEGVDEDQVTANFEHGELEVRIPLPDQQKSRGRRVQIQSGASSTGAGSSNAGNAGGKRSEQQQKS